MKEKVIIFVIGILFGAVLATGSFYVYTNSNCSNNCSTKDTQMNNNGGTPPEMPGG